METGSSESIPEPKMEKELQICPLKPNEHSQQGRFSVSSFQEHSPMTLDFSVTSLLDESSEKPKENENDQLEPQPRPKNHSRLNEEDSSLNNFQHEKNGQVKKNVLESQKSHGPSKNSKKPRQIKSPKTKRKKPESFHSTTSDESENVGSTEKQKQSPKLKNSQRNNKEKGNSPNGCRLDELLAEIKNKTGQKKRIYKEIKRNYFFYLLAALILMGVSLLLIAYSFFLFAKGNVRLGSTLITFGMLLVVPSVFFGHKYFQLNSKMKKMKENARKLRK